MFRRILINDIKVKITAGTVTESTTYIADADNCYFDLDIIDKDSAEHIYSALVLNLNL